MRGFNQRVSYLLFLNKKSPQEGKVKMLTEGKIENEEAKTLFPCFPSVENETSVEMK